MRRAGNAVSVASPGEEPPRGASLGFRHKERTALTRGARSSALLSGKALSGLPLPAIAILRHLGVSPTQPGRASLASSAVIYRRATGCTLPPRLRIPYVGISGRIWNPSTALVPASRRGDGWNFAEKTHGVRRILLLCAGHTPAGRPKRRVPPSRCGSDLPGDARDPGQVAGTARGKKVAGNTVLDAVARIVAAELQVEADSAKLAVDPVGEAPCGAGVA